MSTMQEDFSLSDAKFVCAVREIGTSSGVCNLLGLSLPSIGVYVQRIERRIGKKIFLRYKSSKKIELTADGLEMYPTCRKLMDLSGSLNNFSNVLPKFLQGEIKLTATQAILEHFYLPHMVNFMQTHDNISLVVRQLDDMLHIEQSINEFYFTMEINDDSQTFAYIPYHDFHQKLWASEQYLQKFGTPTEVNDLYRHCLLFQRGCLHDDHLMGSEKIRSSLNQNFNKVKTYNIVGSRMIDKLCEAGLGITLGSEETTLLSGINVRQILQDFEPGVVKCYIKINKDFLTKKIGQYFLDWIFECRDKTLEKIGVTPSYKYKKMTPD
jgi:DNA-binding transcriptional LysR family regulator